MHFYSVYIWKWNRIAEALILILLALTDLRRKLFLTLANKADFIQVSHDRYRDYCIGLCSRGERLGSTPNMIKKSGNLQPSSRVGGLVDG